MPKIFFPSSKPRFVDAEEVMNKLRVLAQTSAKKNHNVEAVYLFGSYAQGSAGLYSDADMLVILTQDKRQMLDRLDEFILAFADGPVPVDVLVYTRAELDRELKEGNHFLARALGGIKLV